MRVDDQRFCSGSALKNVRVRRQHRGDARICRIDVQPEPLGCADVGDLRHRIDARRRCAADGRHDGDRQAAGGAILGDRLAQTIGPHPEFIVRGNFPERVVAETDRDDRLVDR